MTEEKIQDFSRPVAKKAAETIKFKIDADVFEAVPTVGASIVSDITDVREFADLLGVTSAEEATQEQVLQLMAANANLNVKLMSFLDSVLLPESAQRFAERMRSATEPIDLYQVQDVLRFLIGKYSGRPTVPSSSSLNGRGGTTTSSTAGAPAEESTPTT